MCTHLEKKFKSARGPPLDRSLKILVEVRSEARRRMALTSEQTRNPGTVSRPLKVRCRRPLLTGRPSVINRPRPTSAVSILGLSLSVARNSLYNLVGSALPMFVSLATVPAYLAMIGTSRFGVLSITWLLLGYFGLFDLGLGLATAQRIAALPPQAHHDRALRFWTALLTNIGLGIAGGLLLVPVSYFYFGHVMKIEPALRSELLACVPWIAAAVPAATTSGVLTGALQGQERFAILNSISVGATLAFQIVPLLAALIIGPSLLYVLPAAILTRLAGLIVLAVVCWRSLLRGHPIAWNLAEARAMVGFGGWTTVSALFGPLMAVGDRLSIGALVGARSVSFYAVPFSIAERTTIIGNSVAAAAFPRIAALGGVEGRALSQASQRFLMAVMLPVICLGIFAMLPFLKLWVGPAFAAEASVPGSVIMAGMWFDCVSRAPLYALRGYGQPRLVAFADLIQVVPYFCFLVVAIRIWGIEGAAIGYLLRVAMNYVLLSFFADTFRQTFLGTLGAIACLLVCVGSSFLLRPWSADWFVMLAFVLAVAPAVAFWIVTPAQREQVRSFLPNGLRFIGLSRGC